jgi:hypothetical protein
MRISYQYNIKGLKADVIPSPVGLSKTYRKTWNGSHPRFVPFWLWSGGKPSAHQAAGIYRPHTESLSFTWRDKFLPQTIVRDQLKDSDYHGFTDLLHVLTAQQSTPWDWGLGPLGSIRTELSQSHGYLTKKIRKRSGVRALGEYLQDVYGVAKRCCCIGWLGVNIEPAQILQPDAKGLSSAELALETIAGIKLWFEQVVNEDSVSRLDCNGKPHLQLSTRTADDERNFWNRTGRALPSKKRKHCSPFWQDWPLF